MKKIIILFLLTLFFPIKVEGYYCSFSEIARLKKIASNINISYDYKIVNDDALFEITLVNLNKELYITSDNRTYNYKSDVLKIDNYKSGTTVKFYVYPTDRDCSDELLRTINIVLPKYNSYYDDEICVGIENYSLCQKWSTHNLSYTEFVKQVNLHKESLNKDVIVDIKQEENSSVFNAIFQFLIDYYYIILIILIITSGIGIYIINKKSDIYK